MKRRITQRAVLSAMPGGGFTLIEVILVVLIIGIAAAVTVPMMSSAGSMQVRAGVNMIAADLEYAKSMAISRGQLYSVVFNKTAESYQIEDPSKSAGDPDRIIDHPVKKGFKYIVDFKNDGRIDRVDISDVSFNTTDRVTFDYLGSPYDKDGNPLNSGAVTLQSGGVTRTVSVEPVTGFISISN